MNKCVIIANGVIDDMTVYKDLLDSSEHIICVDGGLKHFHNIQVDPTVILGDFDSISDDVVKQYVSKGIKCLSFPKRKDATDSELAIDYAIELNPDEIILLGMLGKRMDHGLTNLHLLKKIEACHIKASIWDVYNKIYYCNSDITLKGHVGDILSIIPISPQVRGITTTGLDYPLKNETLLFEGSRGVSNVLLEEEIRIETSSGEFFVIIAKD